MKISTSILIWIAILVSLSMYSQNFADDFGGENNGDFPAQWDLLQGTAQINPVEGNKAVVLGNGAIVAVNSEVEDYLSDDFTLAFDIYFDEVQKSVNNQSYKLRLWPGTGAGKLSTDIGTKSFRAITIKRHGAGTTTRGKEPGDNAEFGDYKADLRDTPPVWRRIKVEFTSSNLKLYINDALILNIPNYEYNPQIVSIEANSNDGKGELIKAIDNVSILGFIPKGDAGSDADSLVNNDSQNNTSQSDIELGKVDPGSIIQGNNGPIITSPESPFDPDSQEPNTSTSSHGTLAENLESPIDEGLQSHLPNSTIGQRISNSELDGLQAIDEGNGIGWRIRGMDGNNYGNIGEGAIDFNINTSPSSTSGALGKNSFAAGNGNAASGTNAIAMGINNETTGVSAIAIGASNKSTGNYAVALGQKNIALGENSVAVGENCQAIGTNSMALGVFTTARAEGSVALGSNNQGLGTTGRWNPEDPILEVGIGIPGSVQKKNGLTVLKNGNTGIDTHTPVAKLQITGGVDAAYSSRTGYLVIGETEKNNLVFDENEIMARNAGSSSTLYLQQDGGNVAVGGKVVHSSDRRLKTEINDMHYGLEEILELFPKTFKWKERKDDHLSLGLIAQDVQLIIPEIVIADTDEKIH